MWIFKKLYNKLKHLKKEKEHFQKENLEEVDINKLPENNYSKLELGSIITFWFLFRTWIIILLLIYIWYIASNSLDIIYMIFTAFIISIALESLILFFNKILYRSVSIIIAYIILFIFMILWFVILIPFLISHISDIITLLLHKISIWQIQLQNQTLEEFIKSLHLYPFIENKILVYTNNPEIATKIKDFLTTNVSNIIQTFGGYMKELSSFAINAIWSIFSVISQIVLIFTLAIFFSFEKEKVVYTIATLSQKPRKTAKKLKKLYFQLWSWLKWQLLLWIFIWLSVYFWLITLWLFWFNLEEKWTLALIAWLMEFIPYLWPILWSLPSLLVWTLHFWFSWFLWIWILFIIIQQLEWLLVPVIMNKAVWVNPLMIIIAMLIWMKVLWFVWIILAIPLAVIITLLFEDSLKKEK